MNSPDSSGFHGLGLSRKILEALAGMNFTLPTPIQQKAIPIAIEGTDLIGIAQTGTGKTLAYGLPLVQRLGAEPGHALILAPTRELAAQIGEALKPFADLHNLNRAVLIGGESIRIQIQALRKNPRILIATPGRLNDHLRQGTVRLNEVRILVLDEADRMLDMGFRPQIEEALRQLPKFRQTFLFSATMPAEIIQIAAAYMHRPVRTEIAPEGTVAESVTQELYVVSRERKADLLEQLLRDYTGAILLFVRTRRAASKVARSIRHLGHSVAEIHADRSLSQRQSALKGFQEGHSRILVATDIAARGIDVKDIQLVINYDLPDDPENYVHRIGRTGRAGRQGHAVAMATPDQAPEVRRIEKIMRVAIPIARHPELPLESFEHRNASAPPGKGPRRPSGGTARPQRTVRAGRWSPRNSR